jgi:hypothetical protein
MIHFYHLSILCPFEQQRREKEKELLYTNLFITKLIIASHTLSQPPHIYLM